MFNVSPKTKGPASGRSQGLKFFGFGDRIEYTIQTLFIQYLNGPVQELPHVRTGYETYLDERARSLPYVSALVLPLLAGVLGVPQIVQEEPVIRPRFLHIPIRPTIKLRLAAAFGHGEGARCPRW